MSRVPDGSWQPAGPDGYPSETLDVGTLYADVAREMSAALDRLLAQIEVGDSIGTADRVQNQLKQLGYL